MTDCVSIKERLSAYIDEALSSQEKAIVDEHLKTCRECAVALADMKKVIEHIKGLETVEPPPWLTQKVMAKVRAEAQPKKGLFQKLFYPLQLKLPVGAVATIAIALTTLYVLKMIEPEIKLAKAPIEEVAPQISQKGQHPAPRDAEDKDVTPPVLPLDRGKGEEGLSLKGGIGGSSGKATSAPERPTEETHSLRETESIRERFAAIPKVAEPMKQAQSTQGTEAPARAKKLEREATGMIAKDEARQETGATAPGAKLSFMEKKKEETLTLTVFVDDPESAAKEGERALKELEGKEVRTKSVEEKKIVTGKINISKLKELIARLKAVGQIRAQEIDFEKLNGEFRVSIEVMRLAGER